MAETLRRSRRPISERVGVAYRQHRILVGINYPPNEERRREPGEVVDDIPPWLAEILTRDGSIERVKETPDHEAAEPEAPAALTETADGPEMVHQGESDDGPPPPVAVELEGTPELVLLPEDGEG